jgi:hypothetical protein
MLSGAAAAPVIRRRAPRHAPYRCAMAKQTSGQAAAMAEYRAFLVDRAGHIHGVREFNADSDQAAMDLSTAWAKGEPVELWNLARLVRRSPECGLPQWRKINDVS